MHGCLWELDLHNRPEILSHSICCLFLTCNWVWMVLFLKHSCCFMWKREKKKKLNFDPIACFDSTLSFRETALYPYWGWSILHTPLFLQLWTEILKYTEDRKEAFYITLDMCACTGVEVYGCGSPYTCTHKAMLSQIWIHGTCKQQEHRGEGSTTPPHLRPGCCCCCKQRTD